MPIRIQGSSTDISVHKRFWDSFTRNSDTLALSQLWLCGFSYDKLSTIGSQLDAELKLYEPGLWSLSQSMVNNQVLRPDYFFGVGPGGNSAYLLVQGVNFIADGVTSSRVGVNQTGAIKGLVIDSRLDLNAANITFLESNVSFVDGFLRPWSVLVSHKSLKNSNLRCTIELICLEKWALNSPLKPRKTMIYHSAVPINIDAEEYNYTGDKLIQRQVQFAFDRYELRVFPTISNDTITFNAGKSLLGSMNDILSDITGVVSTVRGAADTVTSNVAQGLNAFGLNSTADKVTDFNQRFQGNVVQPVADVIGTGQQYVQGATFMQNAVNNIVGNPATNSDQMLTNMAKNSQIITESQPTNSAEKITTGLSEVKDIPQNPPNGQDITIIEAADTEVPVSEAAEIVYNQ